MKPFNEIIARVLQISVTECIHHTAFAQMHLKGPNWIVIIYSIKEGDP